MSAEMAIAVFSLGIFSGVLLVRYGINLGVKMVYRIKDDIPIFDDHEPLEYETSE